MARFRHGGWAGPSVSIQRYVPKVVHPDQAYGDFSFNADSDPLEAAVKTLARHPMSDDELRRSLILWGENDPDALLRTLIKTGRAHQIHRYDKVFWLGTIPDKEMGATHE